MAVVPLATAVAFAAFCIWLAVRIVNRRERWAKWALIAVISPPVLYIASFGPVCWWASTNRMPGSAMNAAMTIYQPLIQIALSGDGVFGQALIWWASLRGDVTGALLLWVPPC